MHERYSSVEIIHPRIVLYLPVIPQGSQPPLFSIGEKLAIGRVNRRKPLTGR